MVTNGTFFTVHFFGDVNVIKTQQFAPDPIRIRKRSGANFISDLKNKTDPVQPFLHQNDCVSQQDGLLRKDKHRRKYHSLYIHPG